MPQVSPRPMAVARRRSESPNYRPGEDNGGVVAVWRSLWLPPSETFIRDHVVSLRRWRPLLLGLASVDDRLGLSPDRAPFGASGWRRIVGRISRRTGYVGVYDAGLRTSRAALMHAHFSTDAIECLPVARRHRIPLVVTAHGYDVMAAPRRSDGDGVLQGLRRVFEQASLILPVSQFLAGQLLELGAPAEKVRVHYLGIPRIAAIPRPDSAGRVTLGATSRRDDVHGRIVFIGRLVDGKGVEDLIRAYAQLPASVRHQTTLDIVGDGPLSGSARLAAAGIEGRVVWHGHVCPERVAQLLSTASVFVGPSQPAASGWNEALGLVFLEAARAGLPVVAYRTGGVPEAVVHGSTGLLAEVGDSGALSRHIHTLLSDVELAAAFGRAGQERVLRDFDLMRQTQRLEALYDEVAHQHQAAGAASGASSPRAIPPNHISGPWGPKHDQEN